MKKFALPILAAVTVIALFSTLLTYLRWAPRRPLVTVGDQVISKYDYQAALDKQAGKIVLNKLVYTSLVRQAAAKAGVMPTSKDMDTRIADLSRRNPQIAQQANDPVNGRSFRDDLLTDLALENLRVKNVSASDAEIQTFYNRNKAAFTLPSQVQTTMVVTQYANDASTAEHLLQQNVSPDVIARQPRLKVAGVNGFNVNMAALQPGVRENIGKTVLAMKANQVKTLPVQQFFLTFKVKKSDAASTPPLSQIRDQAARQVKLLKADSPQATIAALYQQSQPKFAVEKYSAFFSDVQQFNAQNGTKKTASAH